MHGRGRSQPVLAGATLAGEDSAITFEAAVDGLLANDPNASGFMRKPVRAVFVAYPEEQWARARTVGRTTPALCRTS